MTEKKPHLAAVTDTSTPSDPFDLANLRIAPNFSEQAGVKKLLKTMPVRKPTRQEFFRVHPAAEYRADLAVITLREDSDSETYVVAGNDLMAELVDETKNVTVFTCINRSGVTFLWPIPLPPADGRINEWHRSAREGAAEAVNGWVKLTANRGLNGYEITVATGIKTAPAWREESFQELVKVAFRDRIITSLDHPVIHRLRGIS